jgi:vacuolar-type H+-ATPase subunit H
VTTGPGAPADPIDAALAPLRQAMLDRARADAAATLAPADEEAAALLTDAEREAGQLVRNASAEGAADAAAMLAADRARARRDARRIVLQAQREAYQLLQSRVREAVTGLRHDPGYPRLRDRLTEMVRAELGPGCRITEPPDGGVVGALPGRRVDRSLAALADRLVEGLGAEVQELWAP